MCVCECACRLFFIKEPLILRIEVLINSWFQKLIFLGMHSYSEKSHGIRENDTWLNVKFQYALFVCYVRDMGCRAPTTWALHSLIKNIENYCMKSLEFSWDLYKPLIQNVNFLNVCYFFWLKSGFLYISLSRRVVCHNDCFHVLFIKRKVRFSVLFICKYLKRSLRFFLYP